MLEIAQLSRPPISSIVSVAVSIATVLILYFTGAFDLKEKTLKYETAKLEFEKVQLTNEKGKINFQLDSLRSSLDIVRKEYEQSVVIKIRLDQIIANLRDQKNSDKTRIVELEEEQVKIKSALDSSKKELSKQYPYFSKTPYEQQRIFVQAMNEKEQTIEDLRRELNFCKDSISRRLFRL